MVGIDNLNSYYDPFKRARLIEVELIEQVGAAARGSGRWRFDPIVLDDAGALMELFAAERSAVVVNLAA